jgi:hypothetical protein
MRTVTLTAYASATYMNDVGGSIEFDWDAANAAIKCSGRDEGRSRAHWNLDFQRAYSVSRVFWDLYRENI